MLNRIAVEDSIPLVQSIVERGKLLLANDNTPLQSLVLSMDPASHLPGDSLAESVIARSRTELHQMAREDVIYLATESIKRLHDVTKNTIVPLVKTLSEEVSSRVEPRRQDAILPYVVKMKEIPAIYSNPALVEMVNRFPASAASGEYVARTLLNGTIDRVKELCKTGMVGVDDELDAVLSADHDNGYYQIMMLLQGKLPLDKVHGDYLPGLLVTAQAIYNEPEAGINLTLDVYNSSINALLARTAQGIRSTKARYNLAEKSNALYTTDGRDSITTIVVYGKAYRALLEAGLTPEALIGNEMASRRFAANQLIENKAALETIYHREMSLRNLKVKSEMASIVRQSVKEVMAGELIRRELDAAENARINSVLVNLIAQIGDNNADDINGHVTRIVCEAFYPETDALRFISLIEYCARAANNEEVDIREVTLMATIKYVNSWLIRQMVLADA